MQAGKLLNGLPFGPVRVIDRFLADPVGTQVRLLKHLLSTAKGTEWGKRLGFAEILKAPDVVSAYQERVPLSTYEDLRPDATRIRNGATDVSWPGLIRNFAVSSGTASTGKLIPVSDEMLAFNNRFSMGVGFNYVRQTGNLKLLGGRSLTLPGRIEQDPRAHGTWVGEVSGLQAAHAPGYFSRFFQAVPNEISFLPNWEQKLETVVERTLDMDIRALVMVPSWGVVFMQMAIERARRKRGGGVQTLADVWPNLQLFISGGVALSSYRALLEELIGHPGFHFVETYGASEGFIAFQNDLADPALLLHLNNGVFYEFVRLDEYGKPDARRYTIAEVEPNIRYTFYVTTCSGLWAYNLGDVVRFSATDPFKLVVAGRTTEMLDKYGEMVFADEATEALGRACTGSGAQVRNFHLTHRTVTRERIPAHQWLIEFERPPENFEAFAREIDTYLQRVNRHYQIRREMGAFDLPEIVAVPAGVFYDWLRQSKKQISGQTKVPRMNEERDLADGVLALMQNCASAGST